MSGIIPYQFIANRKYNLPKKDYEIKKLNSKSIYELFEIYNNKCVTPAAAIASAVDFEKNNYCNTLRETLYERMIDNKYRPTNKSTYTRKRLASDKKV